MIESPESDTFKPLSSEMADILQNDDTIDENSDGGIFMSAQSDLAFTVNRDTFDCYLFVIDPNGNITWKKKIPKESITGMMEDGTRYSHMNVDFNFTVKDQDGNNEVIHVQRTFYF